MCSLLNRDLLQRAKSGAFVITASCSGPSGEELNAVISTAAGQKRFISLPFTISALSIVGHKMKNVEGTDRSRKINNCQYIYVCVFVHIYTLYTHTCTVRPKSLRSLPCSFNWETGLRVWTALQTT